jgi:predicted permease
VKTLRTAVRDALHGCRVLRRSPGYALVVILTIALGIGLNVAVFSVVRAVLWRSLPYPDADRIVSIAADTRDIPSASAASGPAFDVREASRSLVQVAEVEGRDASIEIDGEMERVASARATDDLLPLLGAPLALGRTLDSEQDARGVTVLGVVISHELWQRRFDGDPHIIGRHFLVNNFEVAVVGVTRPGLRVFLPPADRVEERVDVWLPRRYEPSYMYRGAALVGRLAPQATVATAQAESDALSASFVARHPGTYPNDRLRISIRPLSEVIAQDAKPALTTLAAAVGFVLLMACVNVANLLIARTRTRERELALRLALGATRLRLTRQLLAENVVVSVVGGAGGVLLARVAIGILDWLRPVHLPRQSEIAIDGSVLLWSAGLTIVCSILFGLAPAWSLGRTGLAQALNAGRAESGTVRSRRLQRTLVVAEVALSIVPLVAAGLMLRTFANLLQAPIGFDPSRVVTARVSLNLNTFREVDQRSAFFLDAVARVRALPGVEAASVGGPLPFTPAQTTQRYRPGDDAKMPSSLGMQQTIMPGYFGVMGIALRDGRDFTDADILQQRSVVIVDERIASQLWQGDAVGRRLVLGRSRALEVVGVAAPIRAARVRDQNAPLIFVPLHVYEIEQTLVVRTQLPVSTIGPTIKRTVEALGPGRPVFDIRPMRAIVDASIDDTRFTMLVLSGFAAAALLLAGVGLYGTLSYLTSQRTQEFGVRVALGASTAGVMRLVAYEGGVLTVLGGAIGLAGAAAITRTLRGLLYGVTPLDAVTIASVVALVSAVAAVAVSQPAWRAARVDPIAALRGD